MRLYLTSAILFLAFFISSAQGLSQTSPLEKIKDIPHETLRQKWMWPHRGFALIALRERPVNYDTAYIRSFYKQIVITLPVSARFLKFTLIDQKSGNKLIFTPNIQYNLGVSVSSRWATFIINSGVKLYTSDAAVKGKTIYNDYQLHLYGRKFNTDLFLQKYSGFYIRNSDSYSSYTDINPYSLRPDIKALNLGVSTVYVVNHRKFSYGNAFAFVEQQKKRAGSPLIGVYYTYFSAGSSKSMINEPFRDSFDSLSLIKRGHSHNFGINLGYIYTFIILKKWYVTPSVTQGIGMEQATYVRDDNTNYHQVTAGAGKLTAKLSLRYDNGRMFAGTMGMIDYFLFRGKVNSTFDYSYGQLMVYAGYRFSVQKAERKILRRLKLIDYKA